MLRKLKSAFLPKEGPESALITEPMLLANKILKYCRNESYNLKRSPPYLPDILPDIYDQLRVITCNNDLKTLQDNEYFSLFIENLTKKYEHVLRLFREGKSQMADEKSDHRRSFSKVSLGLNSMQKELKVIFPSGKYIEDGFTVTKKDARNFWRNNFEGRTVVPWTEFKNVFSTVYPISSAIEAQALKKTIDLTTNDHVSIFEFDVFTRLFHPWQALLQNWLLLAVSHPGFMSFLTYDEAELRLEKLIHRPGSYIFRLSCSHLGKWAIGYVSKNKEILQTITEDQSLAKALLDGSRKKDYLYPNGEDHNPNMSHLVAGVRITVSEQQFQQYCSIYSTFEVCKICYDKDKSTILEPCGHLVCFSCYSKVKQDGSICPFCRVEIRDVERIVVKPFEANWKEQNAEDITEDELTLVPGEENEYI